MTLGRACRGAARSRPISPTVGLIRAGDGPVWPYQAQFRLSRLCMDSKDGLCNFTPKRDPGCHLVADRIAIHDLLQEYFADGSSASL